MWCSSCNQLVTLNGCGCHSSSSSHIQKDSADIIYHKTNGEISELTNLDISNGATLELILETIDSQIAPITTSSILSTTLTYLRTKYVVNNLTQFLVAVSTELEELNTTVLTGSEWTTAARPSSPEEGQDGYNLTLQAREYWNGSTWVQY